MTNEYGRPFPLETLDGELKRLDDLVRGAREADFDDNLKTWQEVHVKVRNELHRLVSTVRELRRGK